MHRLTYAGKLEDYKQKLDKAQENLQKRLLRNDKLKEKIKKFLQKTPYLFNVNIDSLTPEIINQSRNRNFEVLQQINEIWHNLSDEDKSTYYSQQVDLDIAIDDYIDSVRKVPELEDKVQKAQEQYDKQYQLEHTYTTQMPEIFKEAQEFLAEKWTDYDIQLRQIMEETYQAYLDGEITKQEYESKYGNGKADRLNKTDEQFHQMELETAKMLIIDLYNRIKKITGEKIYGWNNLHYNNGALNGIVEGENGTAKVESIVAGGYNIQRLHIRVLVHEI